MLELQQKLSSSEAALKELRDSFEKMTTSITKEMDKLRSQRELVQRELDRYVAYFLFVT